MFKGSLAIIKNDVPGVNKKMIQCKFEVHLHHIVLDILLLYAGHCCALVCCKRYWPCYFTLNLCTF